MYRNNYEVQVYVNGKPVKEYYRNGDAYIEGKQGSRYSLKIRNNLGKRVLAVISVDGIDVLKGGAAEEADSGYVIDGYDTLHLKGYRVNTNDVAEFVFSDKRGSYAKSTTGKVTNCGVIGVRIFDEKEKPIQQASNNWPPIIINNPPHVYPDPEPYYPWYPKPYKPWHPPYKPYWKDDYSYFMTTDTTSITTRGLCGGGTTTSAFSCGDTSNLQMKSSDNSAMNFTANVGPHSVSNVSPAVPDFNLGTAWGDKVADPVTTVPFERGNLVSEMVVYYDIRKNLEKIGISFDSRKQVYEPSKPQAFGSSSYCKPPKNWNQ